MRRAPPGSPQLRSPQLSPREGPDSPTATVKPPTAGSGLAQPGNEASAGAFLFTPSRYWPSPAPRDNEARSPSPGYAASHPHAAILCPGREGRAVATAWRPFWIGEKKLALGSHLTWGQQEPLEPLAAGTAQGGGTEEAWRRELLPVGRLFGLQSGFPP